ncbi:flagellar biosynthesis protein FlhB [Betaproteobacteria bacterium]|nr:flagellar biosynthesis protein FlhB [Betaproteobacteria bacterium]GHT93816.1 flagellar biosynthesis protein FlhB [Betaproteobacteria bacterium]GHU04403.1 flagellar biosynthesis protein FlhB [Betaproteobacteria bacterium]GHU08426.1 flagellar biosynthesis protein FlhB [Betaproteobacteria bacterium]GHU18979.1 flagellar biosynthesis protein FlhB [Betaproteobacteria bacterium]
MAEDSDQEKTEQASGRRLEQAREEGQVPQSRELSTFVITMAGATFLWLMGGWMGGRIMLILRRAFAFDRQMAFDVTRLLDFLQSALSGVLLTLMPLFLTLMVAAVISPLALGGLLFAPNVIGFKFDRLNPMQGIKRVISIHGLVEMLKAILKACLIGSVGATMLWRNRDHFFDFMTEPLEVALPDFAGTISFIALVIVLSLGILALLDVPFQLWQYHKRLRMTREEVRKENKEQEGDPQVKGRIRAMQREMARRRMMAEVPKADVVVTNPTHFSVALKYEAGKMAAPIVVAKGRGELALKIRELAREHGVALLEAPPLARALYAHCELEDPIPAALFTAVAEVMAYVYQLNAAMENGDLRPPPPENLSVPEELDPGAPEE